jgi:nucleoside-diphosphate-sugar epimerase
LFYEKKGSIKIKVLVTGATSFVGRVLIQKLKERGASMAVLSRQDNARELLFRETRWIQGDLQNPIDPEILQGVKTIFHLAAELKNPEKMELVNVEGTRNLLIAAQKAGVQKWIQLSSVGVYGDKRERLVTEDTEPAPNNEYEKTKLASDQSVARTCEQAGIGHTILRPSNVLGQGMKTKSFFAFVEAVRKKKFFFIGPPGAVATFVHVDDVARALIACQDAPNGSIYNLSSDCTWEALIERISTQLGVPKPRLRIPEFPVRMTQKILEDKIRLPLTKTRLDALTRRYGYSSSRIINDLKFRFSKPMPEAICELVRLHLCVRHG